jgi:hypothetical protein
MQKIKNKSMAILIAVLLTISMGTSILLIPNANAHTPPWTLITWAYLSVNPNPVGVGQRVSVSMWVDKPMPEATQPNDIKRHDYQLTITKPDGTTEAKKFSYIIDSTGVETYFFTPDQVGTYKFDFHYPGEVYTWSATAAQRVFTGDIFQPADSKTVTLTVQQEQLPAAITSYPLPEEYWTRPIEGQNTDWYKIGSNFLGTASCQIYAGYVTTESSAPNTPHIMWNKQLERGEGGVVGSGLSEEIPGETFYGGLSYQGRFSNPIIIAGTLFYDLPLGNIPANGRVRAVDLYTGAEIWTRDFNSTAVTNSRPFYAFQFGYLYAYDMYNQHGIIPQGLLMNLEKGAGSTNLYGTTWRAFNPANGDWMFNVTNVPQLSIVLSGGAPSNGGIEILGPNGEHLRYQWDINNGWLAEWNSSKVFNVQTSGVINANTTNRYDWNVTISKTIPTDSMMQYAILDDMLLFSNIATTYGSRYGTNNPYTVGAISLKPTSLGQLLWMKNYTAPTTIANTIGVSRDLTVVDPVNRVMLFRDKETMVWQGYSLDDGSFMWTSTQIADVPDWEYFSTGGSTAYGNLYYSGYGGILYSYDTKTGKILWTYGNGDEGNSTFSGVSTPWGRYPLTIRLIADGKIYLDTSEHSPDAPNYKGSKLRCIDAFTGKEIWTLMDYGGAPVAAADGFLTFYNNYDGQIYCVGKGPSATTVTAPDIAIKQGSSLIIRGTVTDVSAGTKQDQQAARFPNGVPAMSDESQSAWMEYVYMQKPKPTNATGVPVSIDVVDSNGNYRNIGTTTSDSSGMFTYTWTPDIEGSYTVIATFAGSNSYWPSSSETSFAVDPTAPTQAPTAAPAQSTADMYFVPAVAGIIVAIIIVGVVILLALRKRP